MGTTLGGRWTRVVTVLVAVTASACSDDTTVSNLDFEGCTGDPVAVPADEPLGGESINERTRGLVPSEQARLVAGTYDADLRWSDLPTERLKLEVSYDGGAARTRCGYAEIEVLTSMRSSDSGIDEKRRSWMLLAPMPSSDAFAPAFDYTGWVGSVGLTGRRFSASAMFHWLPSGVHATGSLVENGVDRAGSFPADRCLERYGLDDARTAPSMRSLVDDVLTAVNRDPASFVNGGPADRGRFAPPRVDVAPTDGMTCNAFGEASVELSGTFTFEDGTSLPATGALRAIHGLEDPRVKWIELSLGVQGPIDSRLVYPDGSHCYLQAPRANVFSERVAPDVELVPTAPVFQAFCEAWVPDSELPPGEVPPPSGG
jgi:hypothetical protein